MSSNVVRFPEPLPARADDYLGPAEVVEAGTPDVLVDVPGRGRSRARLALAFPYAPAQGDTLLVIGRGDAHYVIGVLQGSGQSTITLPGDVGVHAEGELHLSGGKGVRIDGPEVEVHAGKLRMLAGGVVQRFTSLYQRVSEMLSVHAGQSHTLVEDVATTQAKSAAIITEGTVTINGNEIHLG